ncbi:MAG: hypothetical protein QMD06_04300, partial [Candidatus Altarchaeum sp.]|nr:hypothetical protein [Candidatus Altarchaeum sp.]
SYRAESISQFHKSLSIFTEFINNRKETPEKINDILKNKNILTKKEIVEEIFCRYDLRTYAKHT